MARRNKFTLLNVRGIPIGVDWSWFLVLFLVIWLLSGYYRGLLDSPQDSIEPYALAVISAAGFFGSILLHELGHLVGLDHVPDEGELMYPQSITQTTYGPGDREGLARLGAISC